MSTESMASSNADANVMPAAMHQTHQPKFVVEASNLKRSYEIRRGFFSKPALLQAVGGVSFAVEAGKTLAVVGESGCG